MTKINYYYPPKGEVEEIRSTAKQAIDTIVVTAVMLFMAILFAEFLV